MNWISAAILWLWQWQTLAAGLLAIGAAWIGWLAIGRQIAASKSAEEEKTRRRFQAERAALPQTLSIISSYADSCLDYASKLNVGLFDSTDGDLVESTPPQETELPTAPPEIVPAIKACIEFADPEIFAVLSSLLADLQAPSSRLRSLRRNLGETSDEVLRRDLIDSAIRDAAVVKAHASNLFDYARFRTNAATGNLSWEGVTRGVAERHGSAFTDVIKRLKANQEIDDDPRLIR